MTFEENLFLAFKIIPIEFLNTLYMVIVSTFFSFLIGLPIGIVLRITDRGGLNENLTINRVLGTLVNIGRSVPFAILMVAIIPFTRFIVGTSIGTTATIVPLTIAAAPFIARILEGALKEVETSIIEAALVMGSSKWQIITKVLLPESLPAIVNGITLTMVNIISLSAMAGLIGGGGLGKVAIQYGYQRFNGFLMVITLILLLVLVECVQWIGTSISKNILLRRGKAN